MKINAFSLFSVVATASFFSHQVNAQSRPACQNAVTGFSMLDTKASPLSPLPTTIPPDTTVRRIRTIVSSNCAGQPLVRAVRFTHTDGTRARTFCSKTAPFQTPISERNAFDFSAVGEHTITATFFPVRGCGGTPTGTFDRTFTVGDSIGVGTSNVRFNKFTFPAATPGFIPLEAADYPMRGNIAQVLKEDSTASSVMTANDHELLPGRANQGGTLFYLNAIGGLPSMPDSVNSNDFWDDFDHVVDVQIARENNIAVNRLPNNFRLPNVWAGFNVRDVAEAVHDEYPGSLQADLLVWLWDRGAKVDFNILPFRSQTDFVGYQIRMADLNTWAIGTVSPTNFFLKWYAGRPRPEEIAYKIARRELTASDGVPQPIVNKVLSMNLRSAEEFTAYAEGSPRHPSWPAMHSAASSASFWLAVSMDLTDAEYCEALRVDYAVSYARTVAGVHYPSDNIAGLNLGQEIMAEELASYFATRYGSNQNAVQAKINRLRFDWADFNPATCSTGR